MRNKRGQLYAILIQFILLSILLMSILVITGWLTENREAVQILPDLVPMQFNTALCFLISSLALLLYKKARTLSVFFCYYRGCFCCIDRDAIFIHNELENR